MNARGRLHMGKSLPPLPKGGDRGRGCPCCGAQNFCAASRRTLEILTAATRSPRFFCHWQRSVCSPRARCALAMTYFLHGVRFSGPMWASAPTQGGFLCLLESGTGKVCRPPPPRRLEMAIMLSMESMRQYCLGKKSPGRQKQPGEAFA